MQEPDQIEYSNANGVDGKKNCGDVKSVGPSKAMKDALEAAGLHIDWPDYIYVPVEGKYWVGRDVEKSITFNFDLEEDSLKTNADFDRCIEQTLYRAYMDCNWRYDLKESDLEELKGNGKLSWCNVVDILVASLQTERRLSRFWWVACCVTDGDPIPPREQMQGMCETIYVHPMMANSIRECLMKAYPNLKGCECAKDIGNIIDELAWKLDIKESFNLKTGVAEPCEKGVSQAFYKPMPQFDLF